MNVRRPKCEEQPSKPISAFVVANQFMMLRAGITIRSDYQLIGPNGQYASLMSCARPLAPVFATMAARWLSTVLALRSSSPAMALLL